MIKNLKDKLSAVLLPYPRLKVETEMGKRKNGREQKQIRIATVQEPFDLCVVSGKRVKWETKRGQMRNLFKMGVKWE